MKGDFSRDTFNPDYPNTRVLRFQGSVDLDADWNEQVSSLLFYHRDLASALVGWHGSFDNGFRVEPVFDPLQVRIARGSYYIDGVRAYQADDFPLDLGDFFSATSGAPPNACLIYLEMWERVFTAFEADDIREVALDGLDTSERSRIVTKVRILALNGNEQYATRDDFQNLLAAPDRAAYWQAPRPTLRAWVPDEPSDSSKPVAKCAPIPGGGYTGLENQLYRVEVHANDIATGKTYFKWSRDNGSALYPVENVIVTAASGTGGASGFVITATLTDPHGTSGVPLANGDWVELQCDDVGSDDLVPLMLSVDHVDDTQAGRTTVVFNSLVKLPDDDLPDYLHAGTNILNHGFLRRWDFRTPAPDETIAPPTPSSPWDGMPVATNSNLPLEAGIFVTFDDPTNCVRGDYWLIPARTVIRDVVWPRVPISSGNLTDPDQRTNPVEARRPFHAFAPLAKFTPSTTAGTPPIINEFFGRRQLATNAPIRLGTIAPNDLKSLINQIRALIADDALAGFIARLTKSVPITAQLAPAYLQAEDLNSSITTSGNLRALLGKMPHSVVEIETLTRQEWLDALTFKNGKPLENTDVTAATTVLADARKVCELFRAWPLGILTVEDCNLLKKGVSA